MWVVDLEVVFDLYKKCNTLAHIMHLPPSHSYMVPPLTQKHSGIFHHLKMDLGSDTKK